MHPRDKEELIWRYWGGVGHKGSKEEDIEEALERGFTGFDVWEIDENELEEWDEPAESLEELARDNEDLEEHKWMEHIEGEFLYREKELNKALMKRERYAWEEEPISSSLATEDIKQVRGTRLLTKNDVDGYYGIPNKDDDESPNYIPKEAEIDLWDMLDSDDDLAIEFVEEEVRRQEAEDEERGILNDDEGYRVNAYVMEQDIADEREVEKGSGLIDAIDAIEATEEDEWSWEEMEGLDEIAEDYFPWDDRELLVKDNLLYFDMIKQRRSCYVLDDEGEDVAIDNVSDYYNMEEVFMASLHRRDGTFPEKEIETVARQGHARMREDAEQALRESGGDVTEAVLSLLEDIREDDWAKQDSDGEEINKMIIRWSRKKKYRGYENGEDKKTPSEVVENTMDFQDWALAHELEMERMSVEYNRELILEEGGRITPDEARLDRRRDAGESLRAHAAARGYRPDVEPGKGEGFNEESQESIRAYKDARRRARAQSRDWTRDVMTGGGGGDDKVDKEEEGRKRRKQEVLDVFDEVRTMSPEERRAAYLEGKRKEKEKQGGGIWVEGQNKAGDRTGRYVTGAEAEEIQQQSIRDRIRAREDVRSQYVDELKKQEGGEEGEKGNPFGEGADELARAAGADYQRTLPDRIGAPRLDAGNREERLGCEPAYHPSREEETTLDRDRQVEQAEQERYGGSLTQRLDGKLPRDEVGLTPSQRVEQVMRSMLKEDRKGNWVVL